MAPIEKREANNKNNKKKNRLAFYLEIGIADSTTSSMQPFTFALKALHSTLSLLRNNK